MAELSDIVLLRNYSQGAEDAFSELVQRHFSLVYSVALRHVGIAAHAEEITQAVFIILARKAKQLREGVILEGWLYQTTRLTALRFLRGERRRQRREQEAYMQSHLEESSHTSIWNQLAPSLDEAMSRLSKKEREAVLLRFFKGKNLSEVGVALKVTEAAAQSRVHRGVEKLQKFFSKRGVSSSAEALTGAISAHSIHPAPTALAKTATAVALAKGGTVSTSTLALVKGALKVMAWSKAQTAIVAALIVLAASTSVTLMSQSAQQANLSGSRWHFAGYASPAATLQTMAWAVKQNDNQTMFGCLTPYCQAEFRKGVGKANPGASTEQFLLEGWKQQLEGRTGIRIVHSLDLTTNQVLVSMTFNGGPFTPEHWIRFQKTDDDWKIDDLDPRGKSGPTGMRTSNTAYGGVGMEINVDTNRHALVITGLLTNSAAWQAGLTPGLIVQKIDGIPTAGKTAAECTFLGRGVVGTKVFLELVNPELKETNVVELTRQPLTFTTRK